VASPIAHINVSDAQSFLENTKANLTSLDTTLENEWATYVLGRLADTYLDPIFGIQTWIDTTTTPQLVKMAIAMLYAGWYYDRQFSEEDTGTTSYGAELRANAELLIEGIISGSILLVELLPYMAETAPVFYPTDASSTTDALLENTDCDDNSLGPPKFGMSKVF
jgi:hypothetical protein